MKKTTKLHARKLDAKTKLAKNVRGKNAKKAVARAHSPMARKGAKGIRTPKAPVPVSIATGRRRGGDSDRGLYVRFENPAIKAMVKAAADKTGVPMNSYIVAATLDWVKDEIKLANPKDAAAAERVAAAG
jgi:hypothetical protein